MPIPFMMLKWSCKNISKQYFPFQNEVSDQPTYTGENDLMPASMRVKNAV